MTLELKREQLPELQAKLEELGQDARYLLLGQLGTEVRHPHGYRIFVDKWPDPTFVTIRPDLERIMAFSRTFTTLLYVGEDEARYEQLLDEGLPWGQDLNICIPRYSLLSLAEKVSTNYQYLHRSTFEAKIYEATYDSLSEVCLPEGYTVSSLSIDDAPFVASRWMPAMEMVDVEHVQQYIRFCIAHLPSVAIKDSSGRIVAHELVHESQQMGMLNVEEDHRGKGLAKFTVVTLSKMMLSQGCLAWCVIEMENDISMNLHKKCGFRDVMDVYNLIVHNKQEKSASNKGCCYLKSGII